MIDMKNIVYKKDIHTYFHYGRRCTLKETANATASTDPTHDGTL